MKKQILIAIMFICLLPASSIAEPRDEIALSGSVSNADGVPLNRSQGVSFRIYTSQDGGTPVWVETQTVPFDRGFYSVSLGSSNPFDPKIFRGGSLYLGVQIDGDTEMVPRMVLRGSPWALQADEALSLADDAQLNRLLIKGVGEIINSKGEWVGPTIGLQSPQGAKGPQGLKGDKGNKGDKGDAGTQGLQGVQGDRGETGAQGSAGGTGPQGIPGLTGPQGPQGSIGLQGPAGSVGSQGPAGATGLQGAQGPAGVPLDSGTGTVASGSVTINQSSGVITDDGTDIEGGATRSFTLNNTKITATSVVIANLCSTPNTDAILSVMVVPAAASATIYVANSGGSDQTSTEKICFAVLN